MAWCASGSMLKTSRTRLGVKADDAFKMLTAGTSIIILIIIALMVYKLVESSHLSISRFGFSFISGTVWDPAISEIFGALPLIWGTLVTSAIALLIGVPLSLGTALVLSEFAPRNVRNTVSFMVELLAAVPSVIYGLWGIFTLAPLLRDYVYPSLQAALGFIPLFQGQISGLGVLTGGVILSIMIIPTVSAVSREALSAVPVSQREAALSLGATRWETSRIVILYARSGLVAAAILGLGRAVGETMAITMVIGNKYHIPSSLFDAGYTIAALIANEFTEATYDLYLSAIIEVGLVLFLVAMAINILARLIVWRSLKVFRGASA